MQIQFAFFSFIHSGSSIKVFKFLLVLEIAFLMVSQHGLHDIVFAVNNRYLPFLSYSLLIPEFQSTGDACFSSENVVEFHIYLLIPHIVKLIML